MIPSPVSIQSGPGQSVQGNSGFQDAQHNSNTLSIYFVLQELRTEDYMANRKGPTAGLLGGGTLTQTDNKPGGLFGQQTSQASTFVFGGGQQKPAFGTPTSE